MEIYLIRHGIAADPLKDQLDSDRPLTTKGIEKTSQVAQKIREKGLKFDLILASPLVRAQQTAQILIEQDLTQTIETFPSLSPGGHIEDFLNWLNSSSYLKTENCLALVGHQPDLGNWAEQLVWGKSEYKLELKKAGIIGIYLPEKNINLGQGELFLLTSPKWLL